MKYLLLILALLVIAFLLGMKRAPPPAPSQKTKPAAPPPPKNMVTCAHCGLHLPQDEALPGLGGVFCSGAHRAAHEAERGG